MRRGILPMSFMSLLLPLFLLIPGPAVSSANAGESPEIRGPAQTVRQEMVSEPIFRGRACIYEAGTNNSRSMVLVHGVGEEAAGIWTKLMAALARHYHVIAFDLPGFGKSDKKNILYSPEEYSKFIKWVKERYTSGPLTILGHSMGGTLALHFAAAYPDDVERLIVVDAAGILHRAAYSKNFLRFEGKREWPRPLKKSLEKPFLLLNELTGAAIENMEKEDSSIKIDGVLNNDLLRKIFLGGRSDTIAALAAAEMDFSQLIEKVKAPSLIIWGEEDKVAPLRTGKVLAAKLPHARLEIIEQAGHVPMTERPEIFREVLLHFLESPLPEGQGPREEMTHVETIGQCRDQSTFFFSGHYEVIEIENCDSVLLENVTATSVSASDSAVTLENSVIKGGKTGLKLVRSQVTATNLTIRADTATLTSMSRLDLAGVELDGEKAAVTTPDNSLLLFSLGRIKSPYRDEHIHGIRNVTPDNPL